MAKSKSKNKNNKKSKKVILPKPSIEYDLKPFGYKLSKSEQDRRVSLRKASKKHGTLAILRRLNLIRILSKSHKHNYDRYTLDVEYL